MDTFLVIIIIQILGVYYTDANLPKVDKDHNKKYPKCGEYEKTSSSSGRISNAQESEEIYPWVIRVINRRGTCGGVIITNK